MCRFFKKRQGNGAVVCLPKTILTSCPMKRICLLLLSAALFLSCRGSLNQEQSPLTVDYLPRAVLPAFEQNTLKTEYRLNGNINPFYFSGNFDGDEVPDYAVFLQNKQSRKPAMVFIRGAEPGTPVIVEEERWAALKSFNEIEYWKPTDHFPAGAGTSLPGIKGGGIVVGLKPQSEVRWLYWDGRQWQCVSPE